MLKHRVWGVLLLAFLSFASASCQLPQALKPNFSTSCEIIYFNAQKNVVRRDSGLPGAPVDLKFLPSGQAVAAIDRKGLIKLDLEKGLVSSYLGPENCDAFEILVGKTINNLQPFYVVVGIDDEKAHLLDEIGNEIGSFRIPKGIRSIQMMGNGHFLIANAYENKILEINSTGHPVWESAVGLNHPYDAIHTPQDTFLISDFDNHRVIEIDRQNQILADARGFNHPRRLQILPDGNVLVVDSDLRRIVVLSRPDRLTPLIVDMNRPTCLAYEPIRQMLLVGVEPFFPVTTNDYLQHPIVAQIRFGLVGFLGTLLIVAFTIMHKWFSHPLRVRWKSAGVKLSPFFEGRSQTLLAAGIVLCMVASGFWAWQKFIWGIGAAGLGIALVILARRRESIGDWEQAQEWNGEEEYGDDYADDCSTIQRPMLLMVGLLLFWWSFIVSFLYPFLLWPVVSWLIAPWLCVLSFRKKSQILMNPTEPFWLAIIVIVAVFFRFYRIHEIPYGLWLDETYSFIDAIRQYNNHTLAPFLTTPLVSGGSFNIPNLYLVLLLTVSKTIGASFLTIKCFSLIPAMGIVLGVYYLGKWSWGSWAGRCGALILAMNSWQSIFARWGWLQQWYVFLAILAVAFYVRAYRWKCPRSAAMAGVLLGFGFYTYIPILLTVATIVVLFAISLLEPERRTYTKLTLICGLHLVLVFAPLWNHYLSSPGVFFSRANDVGMTKEILQSKSLEPLKVSFSKYVQMLHVQGDFNPRHNFPNKPLLDPLTGGLFLAGFTLLILRFYRPAERAILIALLFAFAGGVFSLSIEAPNSFRTGVFGPLVCLTAGLPIAALLETRGRFMEEWLQSQGWVIGFAASAFIVITGWNYYRLFVEFPSEETWIATFGHRQHLIYNELTPEDIGVGKLFIHPQFITETMNLYAYFLEVEKLGVSDAVLDHPHYSIVDLKAQKPQFKPGTSILIMPYDYEDLMKEMFPGIEIKVLMNPRNIPQAVMGKVKTAEPAGQ